MFLYFSYDFTKFITEAMLTFGTILARLASETLRFMLLLVLLFQISLAALIEVTILSI